jgi:hypothetical protein
MMQVTEEYINQTLGDMRVIWSKQTGRFVTKGGPKPKQGAKTQAVPTKPVTKPLIMVPMGLYHARAVVAEHFNILIYDFVKPGNARRLSNVRQIFYYICRKHIRKSFPEIAATAGRQDHSTVVHGYRKICGLLERGFPDIVQAVEAIEKKAGVDPTNGKAHRLKWA